MFDNEPIKIEESPNDSKKNIIKNKLVIIISVTLIIIAGASYFIFTAINRKNNALKSQPAEIVATTTFQTLPVEISTSTDNNLDQISLAELEKNDFANFYQEPAPIPDFNFKDYQLPLNVKIDVLNYYDISRKINLDDSLNNLNNNGFSVLGNPATIEIKDFYGAYNWLSNKQVPLLITSDFLLHHHQNTVKQIFKDIEENIFYDNLWRISKVLYESSKDRYEARLAKIGNINDQILEGERLTTAYFAVALKLLEPEASQVDNDGKDQTKFSNKELINFSFTILPYLQSDAGQEVVLIKKASERKKSPVLLYNRDYTDFVVPAEYQRSAKLHNFYLASTWLNSVFPLVFKDKNCPNCLLDKDDARLSLIASTFITKDFSSNQEIKNRWALIYKLISYSKGLRDGLTYRNYNEVMEKLFGQSYDLEVIFSENNPESEKNIEKIRTALLDLNFTASKGALDKSKEKNNLGFKLLSDYYYPNDYIFNNLIKEAVGKYAGKEDYPAKLTICFDDFSKRCNGFSLDIIGLVTDKLNKSTAWLENTNFVKYQEKFSFLKTELKNAPIWHTSNFWSTMGAIKMIFENNDGKMQRYFTTDAWQERSVNLAAATWVDLQLPLNQLNISGDNSKKPGLSNETSFNDNYYIEPNYALVQKILADNEMLFGMLEVMGVNKQVSSVSIRLKEENNHLRTIADLIKKELNGETLSSDDQNFINSLAKQYKPVNSPNNQLRLDNAQLSENIGINLMALVYQLDEGRYIAIGPIFSFEEKR